MVAVVVSRTDVTAADLRAAAARADDPKVARRALAIAMVLDGRSRSEAAKAAAMDRQTRAGIKASVVRSFCMRGERIMTGSSRDGSKSSKTATPTAGVKSELDSDEGADAPAPPQPKAATPQKPAKQSKPKRAKSDEGFELRTRCKAR